MKDRKKKTIAYVTGTRADFGLMVPVLRAIRQSKKLELKIYATGMHLMPEFGRTLNEVKREFKDAEVIKAIFKTDNPSGMAGFTADLSSGIAKAFSAKRPDLVLILGDRPEMLAVAAVCLYLGIPTAQIHGGEKTSTVDESARHAIAKLSSLHFPATAESARRLEKMGEEKWRIHVVGAPALDVITREKLPNRAVLLKKLGVKPGKKIILVLTHPVSENWKAAGRQMKEILAAVKTFGLETAVIYPNSDAGGRLIIREINKEKNNPKFHIFPSLEHKLFLALEREAAVWVGNSSAAMIESASFKTPVVNVGGRQDGRQRADNVINVGYNRKEIVKAINKSLNDSAYLKKLAKIKNPWGDGKTGRRVAEILEKTALNGKLLNKRITY